MKIPNCQRVGYLERNANQRWRHAQQHNMPPVQKFNAAMPFLVFSWSSSNCSNIKFDVVRSAEECRGPCPKTHVETRWVRDWTQDCQALLWIEIRFLPQDTLMLRWCIGRYWKTLRDPKDLRDLRCTWWNPMLWEMHDLQWDCWASPPAESMDMDSWVMVGSCWVKQQKVDATIYNQGLCKGISMNIPTKYCLIWYSNVQYLQYSWGMIFLL